MRYGIRIDSPAAADAAQDMRSQYLAKANLLRDHWRVWALSHQDSLRQLRYAPPGDTATLMRFYAALPMTNELNQTTGITLQDVGISQADMDNERAVHVTWNRHPPIDKDSDARFSEMLKRDFTRYHSVRLSESMIGGYSQFTLWADGRITELARHAKMSTDEPNSVDPPEKELVPAYDFLK